MSKWEQTLSARRKHLQESTKVDLSGMEAPKKLRNGRDVREAMRMIFKLLDKTKKTVAVKDDDKVDESSIGSTTPYSDDQSMLGRPRMAWQKRKREKKADGKGKMESVRDRVAHLLGQSC